MQATEKGTAMMSTQSSDDPQLIPAPTGRRRLAPPRGRAVADAGVWLFIFFAGVSGLGVAAEAGILDARMTMSLAVATLLIEALIVWGRTAFRGQPVPPVQTLALDVGVVFFALASNLHAVASMQTYLLIASTGACLAIVNATSKRLEIRLQRRAAVGAASIR